MSIGEHVVHIIDDDPAVRDAVSWLMKTVSLPTETYGSADEFFGAVRPDQMGCVITDVRMPGMSGLDLQKKLVEQYPGLPDIIITGHGDVEMAVRAMKSGAFDFIQKPFNDQELVDCVYKAMEENSTIDHRNAEIVDISKRMDLLTEREHQILKFIVAGDMNKQIAHKLNISEKTVEVHRSKVMKKLEVRSVAELVRAVLLTELFQ